MMNDSSEELSGNVGDRDRWMRTSIKHNVQPGMTVRFSILQEGDHFRHPLNDGTLYVKTRVGAVPAGLPVSNAINKDYRAETFDDELVVIGKTAFPPRDDFPAGQTLRFGDLPNGYEFIANGTTYRKRTDWYEIEPFVDAHGMEQQRFVKSSANAINEGIIYPFFSEDELVFFEREVEEDLSKHDWIFGLD